MPLRGESVGTAYVRVLADATGFPDSLRDEIERDEPGIRRLGRHHAIAFQEGFDEEMSKSKDLNLSSVLNRALGSNEATQQFFQGSDWKKFKTRMKNEFGDVGALAAKEMEEKFVNSGSLDGLDNEVERVVARVAKTTERVVNEQSKAAQAAGREMDDFERKFRATMNETEVLSKRVSQDNVNNLSSLRNTLDRLRSGTILPFARDLQKARIEMGKTGTETDRDEHLFIRLSQTIDRIGDGIGRAFGKGSRSELLNFFGSFVANMVKAPNLLLRATGNLGEFGDGFSLARKEGETFFASMSQGFTRMAADAEGSATSLSTLFSTGVPGFLALGVALVGIVALLSTVASLVSGLAGIIVALAGSISFAIVGAIVPLIGVLGPLAAVIGVVVAAIATMDAKTKTAIGNSLKPLTNTLRTLGGVARSAFANTLLDQTGQGINSQHAFPVVDALHQALDGLLPIFRAVGRGAGDMAQELLSGFDSNQFDTFVKVMADFIPTAFRRLGRIAQNVGGILANIFVASVPEARNFLGWLQHVTGQFERFLQQNPDKVQKFLRDAADSAHALGDFLAAAARVIGTLLSSGKSTGDTIIGDLTDKLNEFAQFLKDNPDALNNFFSNAKQVARDIGKVALAITDIFNALESPEGQKNLHLLLSGVALLGKLAPLIEPIASPLSVLIGIWTQLGKAIHGAAVKIGNFFDSFKSLGGGGRLSTMTINPTGLVSWIPGTISKIHGFAQEAAQTIRNIAHGLGAPFQPLVTMAGNVASATVRILSGIPGRLGNLAAQFGSAVSRWAAAILSRISDLPGQIIGFFRGLGSAIADAIGSINLHISIPHSVGGIHIPFTASGGIFDRAAARVIGEAGPEAVVPLNRPLSQVDPSVRWLSAIAQGLAAPGNQSAPSKTFNNEFHLTTSTADPLAVAREMVDLMAVTGY